MMRIEDVVVKTIIAGELHIASACKMFMPYAGNCFGKKPLRKVFWPFKNFAAVSLLFCVCLAFYALFQFNATQPDELNHLVWLK